MLELEVGLDSYGQLSSQYMCRYLPGSPVEHTGQCELLVISLLWPHRRLYAPGVRSIPGGIYQNETWN